MLVETLQRLVARLPEQDLPPVQGHALAEDGQTLNHPVMLGSLRVADEQSGQHHSGPVIVHKVENSMAEPFDH